MNYTMNSTAKPGEWYIMDATGQCVAAFGTSATEPTVQKCPPGFYCAGGLEPPRSCSSGDHCPVGTGLEDRSCPLGFYCPIPAADVRPCPAGGHCPRGAQSPQACQAGRFCPPGEDAICPQGHYCPYGTEAPKRCKPLFRCPPGSKAEDPWFFSLAILGAVVGVGFLGSMLYMEMVQNDLWACAVCAACAGLMWLVDEAIALFLSLTFVSVAANWALLRIGGVDPAVAQSLLLCTAGVAVALLWLVHPPWAVFFGGLLMCCAIAYLMSRQNRTAVLVGRLLLLVAFAALIFSYSQVDPGFTVALGIVLLIQVLGIILSWVHFVSVANISPLADVQSIWTAMAKGQDPSSIVPALQEIGLDGIISGEPQGPALALTTRMWVRKLEVAAQTLAEVMYERKRRAQNVEYFKAHTDSLLWDYLRNRLAPVVPPCDRHLPEGIPSHIDGWSFGSSRRTPSGVVYRLNCRRQESPGLVGTGVTTREVARLVDKSTIRDINGIMSLKRMVDVLWMVSCDKWQHPNIQRLFQIYHSPTHIIMRMEYSGAGSLHDRLVRRSRRPLSFLKTSQILQQIFKAVTHLHLAAKVCHRDLKPENFDLHETPDMVTVKLTGFQIAFVLEEPVLCHQKCGTLPFVAPEVLKGEGYHALPVDLWGVGITIIEVICGSRTVDEALGISEEDHPALGYRWPDGSFLQKLLEGFQEPGSSGQLLQTRCLPQLRHFLPSLERLAR
ncbi:CIPK24 [Symbiodinium sp. CCMP2456]|nr:CIPK24 [Symbiodinium sp. CCMP2456]